MSRGGMAMFVQCDSQERETFYSDSILSNYGEYGFKGMLVKPFQVADLEMEISRLISQG